MVVKSSLKACRDQDCEAFAQRDVDEFEQPEVKCHLYVMRLMGDYILRNSPLFEILIDLKYH